MSFLIIDPDELATTVTRLRKLADLMMKCSDKTFKGIEGVQPPGNDCVSRAIEDPLIAQAHRCKQVISQAANVLRWYADDLTISAAAYSDAETDNAKAVDWSR